MEMSETLIISLVGFYLVVIAALAYDFYITHRGDL